MKALPHSAWAAVVLCAAAHAFQDRWTRRCELGSKPCDTEGRCAHLVLGETPDLCWNHDESCDLSVIRRPRIQRCRAWSLQNTGTGGAGAGHMLQYAS